MSEKVTGVLEDTGRRTGTTKGGKPWTAYSGKVDGKWYSFGFSAPEGIAKGDNVTLEVEEDANGYPIVARFTKSAATAGKPAATAGAAASSSSSFVSSAPSVDRNSSIVYQSSRKDALVLVELLISQDALPISAAKTAAGKAKRYEEVMGLVDKLTVQYYYDVISLRQLDRVADAGAEQKAPDALPEDAQEVEGLVGLEVEVPSGDNW